MNEKKSLRKGRRVCEPKIERCGTQGVLKKEKRTVLVVERKFLGKSAAFSPAEFLGDN